MYVNVFTDGRWLVAKEINECNSSSLRNFWEGSHMKTRKVQTNIILVFVISLCSCYHLILLYWYWGWNIYGEQGQYHGYWCPGTLPHQNTSSNVIGCVRYKIGRSSTRTHFCNIRYFSARGGCWGWCKMQKRNSLFSTCFWQRSFHIRILVKKIDKW